MKYRILIPILFLSLVNISKSSAQQKVNWSTEDQAVLDVVNLFFESMTKKDTATLNTIMTLEGRYYGLRIQHGEWSTHTKIHEQYINGLTKMEDVAVERIWNPEIKVHKTIAMLWAPYDIYIDGKFLHCGVDAFSLIKDEDSWKIVSTVFTMEPDGCAESPLGPLNTE